MPRSSTALLKNLIQQSIEQAMNILDQGKAFIDETYPDQSVGIPLMVMKLTR
jgi:hypothetical protein